MLTFNYTLSLKKGSTWNWKDALSSLRHFLATDSLLNMMKNAFYFILNLFLFSET